MHPSFSIVTSCIAVSLISAVSNGCATEAFITVYLHVNYTYMWERWWMVWLSTKAKWSEHWKLKWIKGAPATQTMAEPLLLKLTERWTIKPTLKISTKYLTNSQIGLVDNVYIQSFLRSDQLVTVYGSTLNVLSPDKSLGFMATVTFQLLLLASRFVSITGSQTLPYLVCTIKSCEIV